MKRILIIAGIFVTAFAAFFGIMNIPSCSTDRNDGKDSCFAQEISTNPECEGSQCAQMSNKEEISNIGVDDQVRVSLYLNRMRCADIRFDEVDDIWNFAKNAEALNTTDIAKLKEWAALYKAAKDVIVQIKEGGISSRDEAVSSLRPINKRANSWGEELKSFRESIQTLYLIRSGDYEIDRRYLKRLYYGFDYNLIKFSDLIKCKERWSHKENYY